MQTEAQIRNRLVKKILEIPAKELKTLSDFVSQLERGTKDSQSDISFSKAWKEEKKTDIETHFASEQVLAKDWNKKEEEEAWQDL
ncbi:MAG: hypothetical protein GDA51_10640 [Ekhidna sp.]|nr:hypothetical protein [Ekhidna sp.]MBC6409099.1 hypothetical protein [Ekhidna sp.]MBC6426896.1 hypothetical protein [Ekhidna sp.]